MIMTERRIALGYSQDKLSRLSCVPRGRIISLEAGTHSLRVIPYHQSVQIAAALEISPEEWYNAVMSPEYDLFVRKRGYGNA